MHRFNILFAIMLASLFAAPAQAQSWQCNVPQNMSLPRPQIERITNRDTVRRTKINGYDNASVETLLPPFGPKRSRLN